MGDAASAAAFLTKLKEADAVPRMLPAKTFGLTHFECLYDMVYYSLADGSTPPPEFGLPPALLFTLSMLDLPTARLTPALRERYRAAVMAVLPAGSTMRYTVLSDHNLGFTALKG